MPNQKSHCYEWHQLISIEQDSKLNPEEHAGLEKHLAECDGCRRFRSSLHQVSVVFRNSAVVQPCTDFTLLVMARVAAIPKPVAVRTLISRPEQPHFWNNVPFMPHMPQVPLPRSAVLIGRVLVGVYAILVASILGIVFSDNIIDLLNTLPLWWNQFMDGLNTFRIMLVAMGDLLAATLTPEYQFLITSSFAVTMLGAALLVQLRRQREQQLSV